MQVSDLNTYALIVGEEICHGMLLGGGGGVIIETSS